MKESVLQTNGITKQYKDTRAVDNVSITVRKGDIYGFIGQNGAGKTTMIRLITSLISPTAGEIALFGKSDPSGLADGRKRIGCLTEGPVMFPTLSAGDNLEYYRIQRGIADKTVVGKALESVNLTGTGKKQFRQFSLGMKQRLGLALAIMSKPDFLILDEPINGLDPTGIVEFRAILQNLNKERGMTILISSHILTELNQVATRYGIIHDGKLIREIDDPSEVGSNLEDYFLKSIGRSAGGRF
jgi:ABC-2 type transport system ATP-binding protein